MKLSITLLILVFASTSINAQTNTFPATGNVGIGTLTPSSKLTIKSGLSGVSFNAISFIYGIIAFNRDAATGSIFDPSGQAFQINNGNNAGVDKNLHFQVYNGNGTQVTNNALVISGTDGSVGIGISTPTEKLSVNGKIRAKEVKVETANWPDYVFEDNYNLPDLKKTEAFIKTNKHLPGMPSAKEIEKEGISLGEMNRKLVEKVEELTLYIIEKDQKINTQQKQIDSIYQLLDKLKNYLIKKSITN